MSFDWDSAFWVNSAVAKMVYSEHDRAAPLVNQARCLFEDYLAPLVVSAAESARAAYSRGDDEGARLILNDLAVSATKEATIRWTALWQQLMVANADGYVAVADSTNLLCGCSKTSTVFNSAWADKVVADTGDHYRLPDSSCAYIDPDGHCHSDSTRSGRSNGKKSQNRPLTIPKSLVRGVFE